MAPEAQLKAYSIYLLYNKASVTIGSLNQSLQVFHTSVSLEKVQSAMILITCTFDPQVKKESLYTWRIELSKTEMYWEGWFKGLSALFLTCPVPKLLLLAGEQPKGHLSLSN